MKSHLTPLSGLIVLEPMAFQDERGWFTESYNQRVFDQLVGRPTPFVQDNHSLSFLGVLRGLHYQLSPFAQGKLVRVVRGAVWDVAVDMRRSSATFGQWYGLELSASNRLQLWIPSGFAHGFITLSETADFLYKTTEFYHQDSERAVAWNDPSLAIAWPKPANLKHPLVNAKDSVAPRLTSAECFD